MKQRAAKGQGPEAQLLAELLHEPVTSPPRLQPLVLLSRATQRQHVLGGYKLRNWFDRVLVVSERVLSVAVLLFFGWWFGTTYGYDLVHSVRARVVTPTSAFSAAESIGPRAVALAPTETATVQTTPTAEPTRASVPSSTPLPYPELGRSLPVSDDSTPIDDMADDLKPPRTFSRVLPPSLATATPIPPEPLPTDVPATPLPTAAPPPPTEVPPPPTATPILDQRPTHLRIPVLGLDAGVLEVFLVDGVWQVADYAAGYLHGTGVAGQGNVVLAGHAGIRGAVFRDLVLLRPGHEIWLDTLHGRFHYQVTEAYSVWPNQVDVLYPTDAPTLTLMTCTNWDTQRFVVRATLLDSAPLQAGN